MQFPLDEVVPAATGFPVLTMPFALYWQSSFVLLSDVYSNRYIIG